MNEKLAMQESRHEQNIWLWKGLAMNKSRYNKSRYEISLYTNLAMKISLWKNLAMKSRYIKNGLKTVVKKNSVGVKTPCEIFFLRISNTLGNQHGDAALFRTVFATALESSGGKNRGSFHASFHTKSRYENLAMKSRYEISLWKNLAMKFRYGKSRYEKSRYQISLYKNLAMKKSRYDPQISLWKNLAMTP